MTTCSAIWVSTEAKSEPGCVGSKQMSERTKHRLSRILPLGVTRICRPSTFPSLCPKEGPRRNRTNCSPRGGSRRNEREEWVAEHNAPPISTGVPISVQRTSARRRVQGTRRLQSNASRAADRARPRDRWQQAPRRRRSLQLFGGAARLKASHAAWLALSNALRDSSSAAFRADQVSLPACLSFWNRASASDASDFI